MRQLGWFFCVACFLACKGDEGSAEAAAAGKTLAAAEAAAPHPAEVEQAPQPVEARLEWPSRQAPQPGFDDPFRDAIPAFLLDDAQRGDGTAWEDAEEEGASAEETTNEGDALDALMRSVQVGGAEDAGAFASVEVHEVHEVHEADEEDGVADESHHWEPPGDGYEASPGSLDEEASPEAATAGPCAAIEEAIADRQAYLARVAADRDTFGWVADPHDAEALRLLQGLRRCAEHPNDPDCTPPSIEVELSELEPPRHQYERWPTELVVDDVDPKEIPHDPIVLDLLHQLGRCQARAVPQPLLR